MTKRVLLAGVLGGMAMFAGSSIAHMVLPPGEVGIKEISNETSCTECHASQIGVTSGLYLFPGMGLPPAATHAQIRRALHQVHAAVVDQHTSRKPRSEERG